MAGGCSNCGSPLLPGDSFCGQCGAPSFEPTGDASVTAPLASAVAAPAGSRNSRAVRHLAGLADTAAQADTGTATTVQDASARDIGAAPSGGGPLRAAEVRNIAYGDEPGFGSAFDPLDNPRFLRKIAFRFVLFVTVAGFIDAVVSGLAFLLHRSGAANFVLIFSWLACWSQSERSGSCPYPRS